MNHFQLALEIKENGRAFYEQTQNKIQDPDIKKQFAALAQEELSRVKQLSMQIQRMGYCRL